MSKPFSLFVGLRYLRAKRRSRFLSFISTVSIVGIALGIISLITIVSIMNGFQSELRGRLLGMASHIIITTEYGKDFDISLTEKTLSNYPALVKSYAPFVEGDAILSNGKVVAPAQIRGVDLEKEKGVSKLTDSILNKEELGTSIPSGKIILGIELADKIGVGPGDTISVIVPISRNDSATIIPRTVKFEVLSIFKANVHQYDSVLALMNIKDAKQFFEGTGAEIGARVLLSDMDKAHQFKFELANILPYKIRDWGDLHKTFFAAIKVEKVVMFSILMLIITVAAFNIVSTLAMGVSEKQSDIAILKTIGAKKSTIIKIFIIQGGTIGVIGTIIGTVIGVITALNISDWIAFFEDLFKAKIFSPDVFYVSEIPSVMYWQDVILVSSLSLLITFFATIYPSFKASKIDPARALRYE